MHSFLNVKFNSHAPGNRMPLVKPNKTKPLTALPMKHSLYLKGMVSSHFPGTTCFSTLDLQHTQSCYKIYKYNFTKLEILNNGLYLL